MVCHQSPTIADRLQSIRLTAEAMELAAV
jgi:hypothetical protein